MLLLLAVAMVSCSKSNRSAGMSADFRAGKIRIHEQKRDTGSTDELTLRVKFELTFNHMNAALNQHFQYQLGKNMRIVAGKDTIEPSLSYYVPLIKDSEKEIDVQFLVGKAMNGPKQFIIQDTVLGLDKINIPFK